MRPFSLQILLALDRNVCAPLPCIGRLKTPCGGITAMNLASAWWRFHVLCATRAPFPLTPALSRRERENPRQIWCCINGLGVAQYGDERGPLSLRERAGVRGNAASVGISAEFS